MNPSLFCARFVPVVLLLAIGAATTARAVPSFARQTGLQCIVCHTQFPELTAFGHQFKLAGYTLGSGDSDLPPIAIMLQPGFTHTATGQPGGAAPHFAANDNLDLNQVSAFYAGRLFGPYAERTFGRDAAAFLNKFGVFGQVTYDGAAKTWAWDNTEIRWADTGRLAGHDATYGFYANNNPTMQDVWNSTPTWTFPYSGSGLAPSPSAATLIDGGLAQQVAGVGAYVMLDSALYLDIGAYHTLGTRLQKSLGVDPEGETQIPGLAPYWRLAWERAVGTSARWEVGTFGLMASTFTGRDGSAGHDRYVDVGVDSEFQLAAGAHDFTALVSWIDEQQRWRASLPLGLTTNASDRLRNFRVTGDYLYAKTYGAAVQYFVTRGDADALFYADSPNGAPDSDGANFQLYWLPLNRRGGPTFWPRSNVKLSLLYTAYGRFNGVRRNVDGAGRNARDNDTLYLEAWVAF